MVVFCNFFPPSLIAKDNDEDDENDENDEDDEDEMDNDDDNASIY